MKGSEVNRATAKLRAESYLLLYLALGPGRSLTKLQQTLADMSKDTGVSDGSPFIFVSLNTLKTYSTRYSWVERARLHDDSSKPGKETPPGTEMNERQANMAVAMQEIASRTLEAFLDQPDLQLSVPEVCRLLDVGVRVERQARQHEFAQADMVAKFLSPFVWDICELFYAANSMEGPKVRLDYFIEKADAILGQYLQHAGMSLPKGESWSN